MRNEKILIVDDEEDILELLDFNLSGNGFKVIRAADGEEALKIAKAAMPDLILSRHFPEG